MSQRRCIDGIRTSNASLDIAHSVVGQGQLSHVHAFVWRRASSMRRTGRALSRLHSSCGGSTGDLASLRAPAGAAARRSGRQASAHAPPHRRELSKFVENIQRYGYEALAPGQANAAREPMGSSRSAAISDRARRAAKDNARRATECGDASAAVEAWLLLAERSEALTLERALGYRPFDRLSGFHEMWPHDPRRTTSVVHALERAATGSAQPQLSAIALLALARRYRHGEGLDADPAAALEHCR